MDADRLLQLIGGVYEKRFSAFKNLLQSYGKICNLTAVTDDCGILYKHFLDSVAAEEFFPFGASVAEIGSGGGFPSVPLKIIREDLKFTLIESTGKKCAFLKEVKKELALENFSVLNIRAEDGAKNPALREKFGVCCARAVAPLNVLSEYCLPFVERGGLFIAYKGDCADEIKNAENAIGILGGKTEKIVNYTLPVCGKRTLVIIKKVGATPQKYPRGQGKERKNPL